MLILAWREGPLVVQVILLEFFFLLVLDLEDKFTTTIDVFQPSFFLNAHCNQLLNVPVFWKGVVIDVKSRKLLWEGLEDKLDKERFWLRHVHYL